MNYRLGLKDRLVLLSVLPPEGNLATIRIVHELRMALSPDEAEYRDAQIINAGDGQIRWNADAAAALERDFEIGAKGQEIIREALGKLDKDSKLTADHLPLCDLFEYEGKS